MQVVYHIINIRSVMMRKSLIFCSRLALSMAMWCAFSLVCELSGQRWRQSEHDNCSGDLPTLWWILTSRETSIKHWWSWEPPCARRRRPFARRVPSARSVLLKIRLAASKLGHRTCFSSCWLFSHCLYFSRYLHVFSAVDIFIFFLDLCFISP